MMSEWVSPENIHTIPQSASWNSQGFGGGGGGVFLDWNSEGIGGIMQFGIPNAWRGFGGEGGWFSTEFPEGEDGKSFS